VTWDNSKGGRVLEKKRGKRKSYYLEVFREEEESWRYLW
jgi:hypothetical protein